MPKGANRRRISRMKTALVTGFGAAKLTAPDTCSFFSSHSMMPNQSSK